MKCPNCSLLGMDTDRVCPNCGKSLGGVNPAKVGNYTAVLFGAIMAVLIVCFIPQPTHWDMAASMTNTLFIGVSMVVGKVVGWIIGVFIRCCQ